MWADFVPTKKYTSKYYYNISLNSFNLHNCSNIILIPNLLILNSSLTSVIQNMNWFYVKYVCTIMSFSVGRQTNGHKFFRKDAQKSDE